MNQITTWEQIVAVPDNDFFDDVIVKEVLSTIPTRQEIRANARKIIKDNESGGSESSAEAKLWQAHENLWAEWNKPEKRTKRLELAKRDYVMYKKLTKYFCRIANEYPNEVKANEAVDIADYRNARHTFTPDVLRGANSDIGTKMIHYKQLEPSKAIIHLATHIEKKDISSLEEIDAID